MICLFGRKNLVEMMVLIYLFMKDKCFNPTHSSRLYKVYSCIKAPLVFRTTILLLGHKLHCFTLMQKATQAPKHPTEPKSDIDLSLFTQWEPDAIIHQQVSPLSSQLQHTKTCSNLLLSNYDEYFYIMKHKRSKTWNIIWFNSH